MTGPLEGAGGRRRSFCRYCGALTPYLDSCCGAHRELLEAETPPRDPLESLPSMADEYYAATVEDPPAETGVRP